MRNKNQILLAVDPGLRHVGLALFNRGYLVKAALVQGDNTRMRDLEAWTIMGSNVATWVDGEIPRKRSREPRIHHLVCEKPQVYAHKGSTGADDLFQLVGVLGAVGMALDWAECTTATPRVWKGQVKKEIHHARVWKRLTEAEEALLEGCLSLIHPELQHNVLDAVGIGLWKLKRNK